MIVMTETPELNTLPFHTKQQSLPFFCLLIKKESSTNLVAIIPNGIPLLLSDLSKEKRRKINKRRTTKVGEMRKETFGVQSGWNFL